MMSSPPTMWGSRKNSIARPAAMRPHSARGSGCTVDAKRRHERILPAPESSAEVGRAERWSPPSGRAAAAGASRRVATDVPPLGFAPVHDEDPVPRGVRFLPGLVSLVLAIAMTWPLLLHLGTDASQETYDTPFQTWQLAWIGHALLHHPLALFQSNTYWPEKDSLAFSDVLLGYAPAALIASPGPHAALAIHNLLVIFADALAFLGAYLLARELGAGRWGGLVAGAAYAYAPWRLVQTGHLHVISSGGIPLALYLLLRGYRRRSGRLILSGWLVAAWQIPLGFTLGLQLAYLLAILAVLAAALWLRAGRPRPPGSVVDATAVGAAVFATTCIVVAQPYLRVLHHYPESRKTPAQIAYYSPSARAFLAAPSTDFVWSGLTAHWRNSGLAPGEG